MFPSTPFLMPFSFFRLYFNFFSHLSLVRVFFRSPLPPPVSFPHITAFLSIFTFPPHLVFPSSPSLPAVLPLSSHHSSSPRCCESSSEPLEWVPVALTLVAQYSQTDARNWAHKSAFRLPGDRESAGGMCGVAGVRLCSDGGVRRQCGGWDEWLCAWWTGEWEGGPIVVLWCDTFRGEGDGVVMRV